MKRFLLVALASLLLDGLWNVTVVETAKLATLPAAALSGLMVYVSGWITISYVKEKRLLHAVALGSVLGSVLTLTVLRWLRG